MAMKKGSKPPVSRGPGMMTPYAGTVSRSGGNATTPSIGAGQKASAPQPNTKSQAGNTANQPASKQPASASGQVASGIAKVVKARGQAAGSVIRALKSPGKVTGGHNPHVQPVNLSELPSAPLSDTSNLPPIQAILSGGRSGGGGTGGIAIPVDVPGGGDNAAPIQGGMKQGDAPKAKAPAEPASDVNAVKPIAGTGGVTAGGLSGSTSAGSSGFIRGLNWTRGNSASAKAARAMKGG